MAYVGDPPVASADFGGKSVLSLISDAGCSPARRSRNQRRATAILAVLGHGRDAVPRRRRKQKFLVKKTVLSHYKSNRLNWIPASTSADGSLKLPKTL